MEFGFVSRPARGAVQLVLAMLLTSAAFAQMGGGGMMGGGGGGMMGDPTGGGMMGGFMGGGMMGGNSMWYGVSAVGPDGSAYMIRRAGGTATQYMWGGQLNQKAELVAISPAGATRLLANIEGTTVSEPVAGRDGRIFVTTSEPNMYWYQNTGTPFGNPSSANRKPALVIVVPGTGQTRTVNIDADYVSPPRVADEGATGGYVVYVVASQYGQQLGQTGSGTFLYGFSGDGTQRFKLQLTQY